MKHFKRIGAIAVAVLLCASAKFDSFAVVQRNFKPLERLPEGAERSDYIALTLDTVEYDVRPGDTLWGIAGKLLGSGTRWEEIALENKDVISDVNYIYPGQTLRLSGHRYIPRDKYDRGGLVSKGGMHIASPDMVDHSMFLSTDIENYTAFQSGITIYSLPVANRMGENALTQDWDNFVSEVTRCSENCEGRVSNLTFEKYGVENGCDLYGYYFDFDTGKKILEFAAFIRLGPHNMAEVIGVREKEQNSELVDVTRYIAASFEDFGGQIGMGREKMTDNVGAWDWDYPELHNLFTAAMNNFVRGGKRPQHNMPGDYEVVWEEPEFEKAVRNILVRLWELDTKEAEEFWDRPLMASDISVISSVHCTFYPEGRSHAGGDSIEDYKPALVLECDECKEELAIENGGAFSYQDLTNFCGAKELVIYVNGLTDYSFLKKMPQLRSLTIWTDGSVEDVGFLADLPKLRTLFLMGPDYPDSNGNPMGFSGIEDLSVLENCPELGYLYLQMPRLADFSFLESCPEICTIKLLGSGYSENGSPAKPDLALLPNARFIEFYGESLRFEP